MARPKLPRIGPGKEGVKKGPNTNTKVTEIHEPGKRPSDVDLDTMLLDGVEADAEVRGALTAADVDVTMDGASTFTIVIRDQEKKLLESGILSQAIQVELDHLAFITASIAKQDDDYTAIFEDREIHWLRQYKDAKKAYRDRVTRAEFILSLLREVKQGSIGFFCPELHIKQPIAGQKTTNTSKRKKKADRAPGFAKNEHITVKGGRASALQKANTARVLDVGLREGAPFEVLVAAVMCINAEEEALNGSGGGMFQQNESWPGNAYDIENAAHNFFSHAPTLAHGGAIGLYKAHPHAKLAGIVQDIQRSGAGAGSHGDSNYGPWEKEGRRTVTAYLGGTVAPGASASVTVAQRYAFERKKGEDSWTCIKRLADEVHWRCFMYRGTLYLATEEYLMRSEPMMVISEDAKGVFRVNFQIDTGKPVAEAVITCSETLWEAPPGAVVQLEKLGVANGKWLCADIKRSLFTLSDAQITVKKTDHSLPEPAPETTTQTVDGAAKDASGGGRGNGKGAYSGYFWPLPTLASVGRVDRGQDMETHGAHDEFLAIGNAVVEDGSEGFPGIIYRLTDGPLRGQRIFNGHTHRSYVHSGQHIHAGQKIGQVGHQGASYDGAVEHIEIGFWPVEGSIPEPTHHTISGSKCHHFMHNAWPHKIPYDQIIQ